MKAARVELKLRFLLFSAAPAKYIRAPTDPVWDFIPDMRNQVRASAEKCTLLIVLVLQTVKCPICAHNSACSF